MHIFKFSVNVLWLSSLLVFLTVSNSYSQGYTIEVTVPSLRDTSIVMGHFSHNDKKFIAKDTAKVDDKGKMVFSKSEPLPGGLYVVVLPGQRHLIQFVYSGEENKFSLHTDTLDIIASMSIVGSKENEIFYNYQRQIREISLAMQDLEVKKKDKSANSETLNAEATKLNNKFIQERDNLIADNPSLFVIKLLKATISKQLTEIPKKKDGQPDHDAAYVYYKNHYWDNFDLGDERMLRTPFIESKVDTYIKNLTVQVPDSLARSADELIAKATSKTIKEYLIYHITNQYENPTTVGTDAMFIHMAEKYYLTGVMPISEDGKKRIKDRVNVLKPLLVSKVFPTLTISDVKKQQIRINQIPAEYLVVTFYSPTCGHCKEAAPLLKAAYDKYKSKGVKIVAIAIDQDKDWEKFIKDYQLEELINGYDFAHQIDYRNKFDVMSTPVTYVLDKQKRIVARKMPIEQLSDFLNFTISQKK